MKWFAMALPACLALVFMAATPYTAKQPVPASTKDVSYGRIVVDGLKVLFPKRGQTFVAEMDSVQYTKMAALLLEIANQDTTLQANSLKAAKYRTVYDDLHPPLDVEP